jgi:flagellar export protein FliJ
MAKFQFRLATLQKLREANRDQLRASLAEAYQAQQLLSEQMRAVENEQIQLAASRRSCLQNATLDVNQLLNAQRYAAVLKGQLTTMQQQSELLAQEVEKRRQALVGADQQVRVLEKLHDRQRSLHQAEKDKAETKWMDEIAGRPKETNLS